MPSVKLYNVGGEVVGNVALSDAHFGVKPKRSLVHAVVVAQMANKRHAIAHTKTRGEVSGGGKKPWKQKGTGRARQGSTRSPIWVGGGITFGPRSDRNFSQKINRKAKKLALFMVLSDRTAHDKLLVVDVLPVQEPKTAVLVKWLKQLPAGRKTLVVIPESNPLLVRMARNLQHVKVITVNSMHVTEIVNYPTVLFEQKAIEAFEKIYS